MCIDFLLCHDDELDSRRIAFMLYLTKDWKETYGGGLDIYTATGTTLSSAHFILSKITVEIFSSSY